MCLPLMQRHHLKVATMSEYRVSMEIALCLIVTE